MKSNRRGFLLGTPLAAFGLAQFGEEAFAQTSDAGAPPADVVDFWVGHMGVPAHMVLGGVSTRGRAPAGPETSNLAREPLFIHYDPDDKTLMTADQILPEKMHSFTDAKVEQPQSFFGEALPLERPLSASGSGSSSSGASKRCLS